MISVTANIGGNISASAEFKSVSIGAACVDATQVIKDSSGTVLYTNNIPSGTSADQTITDATITNSDSSNSTTVKAQGSKVLTDITITDLLVGTSSYPAIKDIDFRLFIPIALTAPTISGNNWTGQTLTAVAGTYTGATSVTGQWQRNGVNISGATSLTYVQVVADAGSNITYYETATNSFGTTNGTSNIISSFYSDVTSLHEWNYKRSTEVGSTVTAVDSGSVGGLNMTNPTASQKPTLDSNGWAFDGVNDVLTVGATNFRSGDAKGVIYCLMNYTAGTPQTVFSSANNGGTTNYLLAGVISGMKPQINFKGTNIKRATNTVSGWVGIAFVQDGVNGSIFINGVKQTTYTPNTLGANWFGGISANNISIGGTLISTPSYTALKCKYISYSPYVDDNTVLTKLNELLNAGL